jgi:hypothetical protein
VHTGVHPDFVINAALPLDAFAAEVPYHNFHHAVDVTVSSYLILTACDARSQMKPVDAFSLMVAAIGHDAGHPGLTNGRTVSYASCWLAALGIVF